VQESNYRTRLAALARRTGAWGCTEEEVKSVEVDQGVALPESYRFFLLVMGRDVGGLFGGSVIDYATVIGLKSVALELIADAESEYVLPSDAVVFSMHDGYQILFLLASEGPDPRVWFWIEDGGWPARVVSPSLVDLLEADEASGALPDPLKSMYRRELAALRRWQAELGAR
jgi:hypothetical protein